MDENKELGLKLIENKGREIAWLYFLEPSNQTDILRKLKPERYKKYKKSYDKIPRTCTNENKRADIGIYRYGGNDNKTTECFNAWKEAEFVEEVIKKKKRIGKGGKPYFYPKKMFLLNMDSIYYYLEKEKKLKINDKVKFVLEDFLKNKNVRIFLFKLGKINNKDVVNTVISFFRYIHRQTFLDIDTELVHHYMLDRVLNKEAGKEYFKIIPLVENFIEKISLIFSDFQKIDETFDYVPFLERTHSFWRDKDFKPADKVEKQIVLLLNPKSERRIRKANLSLSKIKNY